MIVSNMADNETPGPEARKEIAEFTLQICKPLYWHDRNLSWPKTMRGASCFVARFPTRLIMVTADHVYATYLEDLGQNPSLVCQLGVLPIDLNDTLIDRDQDLDIATFAIAEADLARIPGTPVDCTGDWPPPDPQRMRAVSLAGFPEHIRVLHPAERAATFAAYGALGAIEDFSDREIIVTYEPERDERMAGVPKPPLGFNMSGCSGGPALMHGIENGLHRWFLSGFIIRGSGISEGDAQEFDIVRLRRIHFIKSDGTLSRELSGWLP
jgi:hypothetical protein